MSGGKVKFTVDTKMIIGYDGQFIRTESTDTANGFTLTKTELTGWDQKLGKYSSYAFTNIAPLPRTSHGDFKDDRFISVSEPWSAEEMSSVTRQTLIKISDTKIRLILELSTGKYWATEMDVTLTKSPD